jgi:hypothetical protein
MKKPYITLLACAVSAALFAEARAATEGTLGNSSNG